MLSILPENRIIQKLFEMCFIQYSREMKIMKNIGKAELPTENRMFET